MRTPPRSASLTRDALVFARHRFLLALGLALPPWSVLAVLVAVYASSSGGCAPARHQALVSLAIGGVAVASAGYRLTRNQLDYAAKLPEAGTAAGERRLRAARAFNAASAACAVLILLAFTAVATSMSPCVL